MDDKKIILVLNMGMKSIRSIIFDSEGNKLATAAVPIETSLVGEMVTQQPNEWWEKAGCVIRQTLDEVGYVEVDFLTVTTSSSCLLGVDESGNALMPCMMVSDRSARKESDMLDQMPSFQKIKEKTGLAADSSLMIPKALWVKNVRHDVFEKVYKFIAPNDYLLAKFTGRYVTDYLNAYTPQSLCRRTSHRRTDRQSVP